MRFGISTIVSDELAYKEPAYKQYVARDMQIGLGESLVDAIWKQGGVAAVRLELDERRDIGKFWERNISLIANVSETAMFTQKIYVPHFEYFPLDWVCEYCGTLNDGLSHPRSCCKCQASRSVY